MLFALIPFTVLAVGLRLADKVQQRQGRDLNRGQRIAFFMFAPLAGGLHRMKNMLPRYWSDHPESKYPRHSDYWPPK